MTDAETKPRVAHVAVLLPTDTWELPTKGAFRKEFNAKSVRIYKSTGRNADLIYLLYRLRKEVTQDPEPYWKEAHQSVLIEFDKTATINVFACIRYAGNGLGFFRIFDSDLSEMLKLSNNLNSIGRLRDSIKGDLKFTAELQDDLMLLGFNPQRACNNPMSKAATAFDDEFTSIETALVEKMRALWEKMHWKSMGVDELLTPMQSELHGLDTRLAA
jgi:hypothetical protein